MNDPATGPPCGTYRRRATSPRGAWLFGLTSLLGTACSDTGTVELNWVLVDQQGSRIYPAGQFTVGGRTSSCNLPGRIGDETTTYDLEVVLEVCDTDCPGGCADPQCAVMEPLRFSCTTARGTAPQVPASEDPYFFLVGTVLTLDDGTKCTDPAPTCITVPGPRERLLHPGLTVDLQVYQIALGVDSELPTVEPRARLDLEACGCV